MEFVDEFLGGMSEVFPVLIPLVIFFIVIVIAGIVFSRRSNQKVDEEWQGVAQQLGLTYVPSELQINIGMTGYQLILPGLSGTYRRYPVNVTVSIGDKGRDNNRYILRAEMQVANPHQMALALVKGRSFGQEIKQAGARSGKTGNPTLDKHFKYMGNLPNVEQRLARLNPSEEFLKRRVPSRQIEILGNRLVYVEQRNRQYLSSEGVPVLLDTLAEIAAVIDQ